eukprot:scaffold19403_cov66-Phaeocystis_antarctica.AAC.2
MRGVTSVQRTASRVVRLRRASRGWSCACTPQACRCARQSGSFAAIRSLSKQEAAARRPTAGSGSSLERYSRSACGRSRRCLAHASAMFGATTGTAIESLRARRLGGATAIGSACLNARHLRDRLEGGVRVAAQLEVDTHHAGAFGETAREQGRQLGEAALLVVSRPGHGVREGDGGGGQRRSSLVAPEVGTREACVGSKVAHTSASLLFGSCFQGQVMPQAAPSFGQPRPISRLGRPGRPHYRPWSRQRGEADRRDRGRRQLW